MATLIGRRTAVLYTTVLIVFEPHRMPSVYARHEVRGAVTPAEHLPFCSSTAAPRMLPLPTSATSDHWVPALRPWPSENFSR